MKKKQEGRTAAELLAELNADPAFVARQREKENALRCKEIEWRRAEAPIVTDLRQVGEEVESVWDLVNTTRPYPRAIPILLKHLGRPYPDRVREGIARALAVPGAKVGLGTLLELFSRDPDQTALGSKQTIGRAIAAASDDEVLDDLIALVRDKKHGANRIALLDPLVRSSDPRAHSVLLELREDPELSHEVRVALRHSKRRQRVLRDPTPSR